MCTAADAGRWTQTVHNYEELVHAAKRLMRITLDLQIVAQSARGYTNADINIGCTNVVRLQTF